jgi:hypothetical protein
MGTLQNATVSCPGDRNTQESGDSIAATMSNATKVNFVFDYDANMRLMSIKYSEFHGQESEWNLDTVTLGPVNLLVGRNSTGKTRLINVIASLGRLLADKQKGPIINGSFDIDFSDQEDMYHYTLKYDNRIVIQEEFSRGAINLLHRGDGGLGSIFMEEVKKHIRFRVAGEKLATVAKRDSVQHPFLDKLEVWGNSVRHFEFGKGLGHSNLAVAIKGSVDPTDEADTTQIVRTFNKGKETFGNEFVDAIKADMKILGYDVSDVGVQKPSSIVMLNAPAALGDLYGISVKEQDLRSWTDQLSMSQGMFRACSMIIQLNYSILAKTAATILVDDIGEGLDYERSYSLVKLLRDKVLVSDMQLVMSTNDRFIMNAIPLDNWCVLQRIGHNVRAFNYANASAAFERFKKTGLSNFDLLTSDYIQEYVKKASPDGENGHLRRGSDGEDLCREPDQSNGGDAPIAN